MLYRNIDEVVVVAVAGSDAVNNDVTRVTRRVLSHRASSFAYHDHDERFLHEAYIRPINLITDLSGMTHVPPTIPYLQSTERISQDSGPGEMSHVPQRWRCVLMLVISYKIKNKHHPLETDLMAPLFTSSTTIRFSTSSISIDQLFWKITRMTTTVF
jgi:hypothetical protein